MSISSFNDFLVESEQLHEGTKRAHLTHIEDSILDDGASGGIFALKILSEFGKILDGGRVSRALNVSVKWDGAPALIFGPDPADGKFFVATKGAFAKTPKLAKTHADIDAMYSSGVKVILHLALDELSKLQPKNILQGDVLFTSQTTKVEVIEGKSYLTFQPNTILYAVGVESDLARKIHTAQMGIVIHTAYTGSGSSLANFTASAVTPGMFSSLKKTSSVLAMDAGYDDLSGTATFTQSESADFYLAVSAAQAGIQGVNAQVYDAVREEPFRSVFAQFINQQIRNNRVFSPRQAPNELLSFLSTKQDKEMSTRKTPEGQDVIRQRYARMIDTVISNKLNFVSWFSLHAAITRAKDIVVRKLGQASKISSFVRTDTGVKVTGPEGFVAVSRNGKAVKLVDRLEFSRLNFIAPKVWD